MTINSDHIVENRRYEIVEEEGCFGVATNSGLLIVLIIVPKVILPLISVCYCRESLLPLTFVDAFLLNKPYVQPGSFGTSIKCGKKLKLTKTP